MFRKYLKITRSTLIIYFKKLFLWKIERERDWRENGNNKEKKNKKQKTKKQTEQNKEGIGKLYSFVLVSFILSIAIVN